jgi:hypothetical protein
LRIILDHQRETETGIDQARGGLLEDWHGIQVGSHRAAIESFSEAVNRESCDVIEDP